MPVQFYSYEEAADHLGVSVSTLKRKVRAGEISAPVKLSAGRVGFPISVIHAHIAALGADMPSVGAPQVIQTLQTVSAQIDSLCWNSDASNLLEGSLRNQLASETQGVLASVLALADKFALVENIWIDLYGPVLDGVCLTRLEAIRQLCNGSRCSESFAETLHMLAEQVANSGVNHG